MDLFDMMTDLDDCISAPRAWQSEQMTRDPDERRSSSSLIEEALSTSAEPNEDIDLLGISSQPNKKRKTMELNIDGCMYSGNFQDDTMTGIGTILFPQGDR